MSANRALDVETRKGEQGNRVLFTRKLKKGHVLLEELGVPDGGLLSVGVDMHTREKLITSLCIKKKLTTWDQLVIFWGGGGGGGVGKQYHQEVQTSTGITFNGGDGGHPKEII